MTARLGKRTTREIERRYFDEFSKAYSLPAGTIEYGDKPDVVIRGDRTTGIELTRFYLLGGSSFASEQRQKPLRDGVVSDAHQLHSKAGGKKFELTIGFDPDRPITPARRKALPKELSAFAATIGNHPSGSVDRELFQSMPEISTLYLNSKEYDDAKWRLGQVYAVDLMSQTELERIIREKEAKAADYFACDDYWLLIIVDWMDNAQEQEISVGHVKIASNVFQRIIVYKPGFDDILVVWP